MRTVLLLNIEFLIHILGCNSELGKICKHYYDLCALQNLRFCVKIPCIKIYKHMIKDSEYKRKRSVGSRLQWQRPLKVIKAN
jgi:hypothetical protein